MKRRLKNEHASKRRPALRTMRIAALTHSEMTEALNRGWGHRDSRSPMLLQEERAGVEIKVAASAIQDVLKRDG